MRHFNIAVRLLILNTLLLGLAYPLFVTGIAQLLFPRQANGSLIVSRDKVIGSELIGQRFVSAKYFHSRPSSAGRGYDASASGASNLGPTSKALANRVGGEVSQVLRENPAMKKGDVPADMVTSSGSGLDPDISAANAQAQAVRIAGERGLSLSTVNEMIKSNITKRQFGLLGEERVNVVKLNILLDEKSRITTR